MGVNAAFHASPGELGIRIGDPELILPGEEPRTLDAEHARHWALVHGEVLALREGLLAELRRSLRKVSDPSVARGLRANARSLELAVNRSRRRFEFWSRRLHELAGSFAGGSRA